MAKTSRSYNKKKALNIAETTAMSKILISPDATLGPESSYESTQVQWMGPDSTSAPSIEEESEPEYASGGFELLDKFLQGRINLPTRSVFIILTLAWFGFLSFLFVRDSELGRLETIDGIKWLGIKVAIYTVFYILVTIVVIISNRVFSKPKLLIRKPPRV